MTKASPFNKYFTHFILFNLCFLVLQVLLIYTQSRSLVSSIKLPWSVHWELIETFFVHICLYLILSLFQTWLLIGVIRRAWIPWTVEQCQVIIWSLFVCFILSANAYYFPLSIFSKLFSPPVSEFYIAILFFLSLSSIGLLIINGFLFCNRLQLIILAIATVIGGSLSYFKPTQTHVFSKQPDIIILGIDSLSPESINNRNMPFISSLLNHSIQFTNTISPLARTYPAWCSILTGLYPIHHHAYENLVAKNSVNNKASIVWELNRLGYNTIYATDDRRFNNMDKEFGFQHIIGPKIGVNDVILGSFNDFPLGNLFINFSISAWLFPYNHSNRASFFSYYPHTFSHMLEKELATQSRDKPLFLAVHFALPHWPYAWAKSSAEEVDNEFSLNKRNTLYQRALKRVDTQFQAFYSYLKSNHYLKNSLIIFLSDHGEALYYPNSRLTNYHNYQSVLNSRLAEYFRNDTATDLDKSAGHGSDILSPKQYHSVLAFNIYKNGHLITGAHNIVSRIALIDLAPTILSFLKIPSQQPMDGISLLPFIVNTNLHLPERSFFIESGMFPNQDFSKEKAIAIGHQLYNVNLTTGLLELKPDELIKINNHKLYGVIKGDWVLALYPDETSYIPVIQNLKTGQWIDNLDTIFAKNSPAASLAKELSLFYRKQLIHPVP